MSSIFHDISTEDFLKNYWQKKPLLIRQGLPNFQSPITKEELGGLSCEEDIESRIIIEKGGESPWQLLHGPFDEKVFSTLPSSHWTLLVQGVDHWSPEVNQLLKPFDFIPNWRLDDIMMSYATTGGNVGAHYDLYDVFLIQAEGKRKWSIGQTCTEETKLTQHTSLKVLETFNEEQSWILEPGDILYLPPQVAHHGIACDDDCITISVGHRAPSHKEVIHHYNDFISENLSDFKRYQDPELLQQKHSGEITFESLSKVKEIIDSVIKDKDSINHWFGCYVTEPKYTIETPDQEIDSSELLPSINSGDRVFKNEGSRFCYIAANDTIELYVDGVRHVLDRINLDVAETLCSRDTLEPDDIKAWLEKPAITRVLTSLINQGSLYLE